MRQEVSAYQNKLRQLDNKQQELIKDNLELKELCLYLDEERGGVQRDDGDGSSSSTNAEETAPPRPRHTSTFNGKFSFEIGGYIDDGKKLEINLMKRQVHTYILSTYLRLDKKIRMMNVYLDYRPNYAICKKFGATC